MHRVGAFSALLAIGFWFLATSFALAATYFEFNPDYSQSLLVASAPGAVSEVFLPRNDYLAGFDLWLSNASAAGPVTFTLYSPTDTVMAVRTVTVPAIADSENGTRVAVALPSQLAVNGSLAHRIGIATTVPTVRVYYAEQNRIIAHNGAPLPAYTGGVARIGAEDQGFSLKFALHENSESSPPQLSGVTVRQPGIGTAVLDFNANEPVDSQVVYLPAGQADNSSSVPFSGQFSSCPSGLVPCSSTLSVTPGVDYSYTLTVRDVWGNATEATGQFTSTGSPQEPTPTPTETLNPTPTISASVSTAPTAVPDASAPVISNLRAANVSTSGATIAWTTNEAANSLVIVQTLPFLINAAGGSDSTIELEHAIAVSGLDAGTFFQALVTSSDGSGNSTIASVSFQTLSTTATPPPGSAAPTPTPTAPQSPTLAPTVSVAPANSSGEQIVTWTAPSGGAPTDGYRVDIIGKDGKLIRSVRTDGTRVNVGAIPEGATVVVYSDNKGLFEKVAAPATVQQVSFLARLLSALPYFLGSVVVVSAASILVLKFLHRRKTPPPISLGLG